MARTTAMGFVSMKRGVSPTEMKTGGPVLPLCLDADVIAKTLCAAWYLYTVQVRNGCYLASKWLPVTLRRRPVGKATIMSVELDGNAERKPWISSSQETLSLVSAVLHNDGTFHPRYTVLS